MSSLDSKPVDEKVSPPSPPDGGENGGIDAKHQDLDSLTALGYKPELRRNRSLFTLLFQYVST